MEAAKIQSGEQLLSMMRGFQVPCVLAAAADLDVFNLLNESPRTAGEAAARLACDERATTILLDALAGIGLLVKTADRYALSPDLAPLLTDSSPQSVAAMLRHQANCLRAWARLPWVVRTGSPAERASSVRGPDADHAAFIEAMHVVSRPVAERLIQEINPGAFRCVLDMGGATGTWTLAWLRAEPSARAILFDLPAVIPMAERRMASSDFAGRVRFVAGDYNTDPLPRGADLAWISAIVHQNSREQNRSLFRRVAEALPSSGLVLIRDVVMEESHTAPPAGALFAVNMLVNTQAGGTFTLAELREDLESAGLAEVELIRRDEAMNSVVRARRTG